MHFNRSFTMLLLVGFLASLLGLSTLADAYPKPRPIPARPELNFEPGPLRIRQSQKDGSWYWYMTYTVSNYTGEDRIWAPTFVLFTDRGDILESGRDVHREISEEFHAFLGNELLEPQHQIIGDLLQGERNARSGLILWPAPSVDVNEVSLFSTGISSETAVVEHPVSGKPITLHKTLMMEYLIPGNATALGDQSVQPHPDIDRSPRWIYR